LSKSDYDEWFWIPRGERGQGNETERFDVHGLEKSIDAVGDGDGAGQCRVLPLLRADRMDTIDLGFASNGWTRGKDEDWRDQDRRDEDRSGADHD
jgi:hypothetical protein